MQRPVCRDKKNKFKLRIFTWVHWAESTTLEAHMARYYDSLAGFNGLGQQHWKLIWRDTKFVVKGMVPHHSIPFQITTTSGEPEPHVD